MRMADALARSTVLAIESSCDETGVGIAEVGPTVR